VAAAAAAAVVAVGFAAAPAPAAALRPIPDTSDAVHVWDDQLPDSMSDAQVRFVAQHVDGTQKVGLDTARRLGAVNPGLLVLHYRLGIGDGPVPFRIGARWASDYRSVSRHESWFWHIGGHRVLQRQWDWYLMDPDSGWRRYWASRALYEVRLLGGDGVFADSLSVPQYLGASGFSPPLRYFVGEAAWTFGSSDAVARGFVLGSYLLVKGSHTFLNMDIGSVAQWFPEYGVSLGPAVSPPPASIDALRVSGGLYARSFAHGVVVVNPGTAPGAVPCSARFAARAAGRRRKAAGGCLDGRLAAVARARCRRIGDGARARRRCGPAE
jgi:Hypothetical glycosyl hydrolase family 15